ncbi:MAG TPA: CaiB/BaiF CoA-transferase family protein [Brevundimonas sp.]|jgi:alpha-methylacyl-CoA racemase|uniref:CaiB/BaiF CoA transferase family protein n=1 Tax=Brevundimonas sp. TaxID=1871086 RepID=UPI002DE43FD9|nr:CaiB/BaiF CoA-transferase family protein [Brevundimonas sp.]
MGPLSDLRIIEFDGLGPVTFAGMLLADMGAQVIRLTRAATAGAAVFEEVGGAVLHRGRAAVAVDLKSPHDRDRVLDLLAGADALIEGFRPAVMERLGLGPVEVAARAPALVYGRVTGWGQWGPMADQVGHDINYLALSGVLHALGEPDRPPRPPLNLIGDYAAGAQGLVIGLLAGVLEARRTGVGRVVDSAMTDGAAQLAGLFAGLTARGLWSETRGANLLDGGAPFYRCYACRDGRFVAVGALEPRFYAALLAGLGIPAEEAPQHDPAGWPRLHDRFAAVFASADRDDWATRFAGTEACVTPVLTPTEARIHPHNVARETFDDRGFPAPAPVFDGRRAGPRPADTLSLEDAAAAWRG